MRRRAFISLLAGAAVWPVVARAQPSEGMRLIGVLMNRAADDPQGQARVATFKQALQQLGWTEGRDVRMDTRWGADDVDRERGYGGRNWSHSRQTLFWPAATLSVTALQHVSRTLPIVFVGGHRSGRCWLRR